MPCDPCSLLLLGGTALVAMLASGGKDRRDEKVDEDSDIIILDMPEGWEAELNRPIDLDTGSDDMY